MMTKNAWFVVHREHGLVELACEHGVGHPSKLLTPKSRYYSTHGCCGCCQRFRDAFERAELAEFAKLAKLGLEPHN